MECWIYLKTRFKKNCHKVPFSQTLSYVCVGHWKQMPSWSDHLWWIIAKKLFNNQIDCPTNPTTRHKVVLLISCKIYDILHSAVPSALARYCTWHSWSFNRYLYFSFVSFFFSCIMSSHTYFPLPVGVTIKWSLYFKFQVTKLLHEYIMRAEYLVCNLSFPAGSLVILFLYSWWAIFSKSNLHILVLHVLATFSPSTSLLH